MLTPDQLEARGKGKVDSAPFVLFPGLFAPNGVEAVVNLFNIPMSSKQLDIAELATLGLFLLGSGALILSGVHDQKKAAEMRKSSSSFNSTYPQISQAEPTGITSNRTTRERFKKSLRDGLSIGGLMEVFYATYMSFGNAAHITLEFAAASGLATAAAITLGSWGGRELRDRRNSK